MTYNYENHIKETDAKSGRRVKGMMHVLVISTIVCLALLLGIYGIFAI